MPAYNSPAVSPKNKYAFAYSQTMSQIEASDDENDNENENEKDNTNIPNEPTSTPFSQEQSFIEPTPKSNNRIKKTVTFSATQSSSQSSHDPNDITPYQRTRSKKVLPVPPVPPVAPVTPSTASTPDLDPYYTNLINSTSNTRSTRTSTRNDTLASYSVATEYTLTAAQQRYAERKQKLEAERKHQEQLEQQEKEQAENERIQMENEKIEIENKKQQQLKEQAIREETARLDAIAKQKRQKRIEQSRIDAEERAERDEIERKIQVQTQKQQQLEQEKQLLSQKQMTKKASKTSLQSQFPLSIDEPKHKKSTSNAPRGRLTSMLNASMNPQKSKILSQVLAEDSGKKKKKTFQIRHVFHYDALMICFNVLFVLFVFVLDSDEIVSFTPSPVTATSKLQVHAKTKGKHKQNEIQSYSSIRD
jgi:hypothetical protein